MPLLLVNETFPRPATELLRERGVDVISVQEAMPGAHDEEVLRVAAEQGRWLITYDRDYGELVFSRGLAAPPAIVYLRQEPFPATRPAELLLALLAEPESAEGYLVVLSEGSVRRRPLPQAGG